MKRALIVWGGWHGHEPEQCAQIVQGMLQRQGFAVRIETRTAAFADPGLQQQDLIVPIFTMSKLEKAECANLTAAVRSGPSGRDRRRRVCPRRAGGRRRVLVLGPHPGERFR